jgi:hypothetical protein
MQLVEWVVGQSSDDTASAYQTWHPKPADTLHLLLHLFTSKLMNHITHITSIRVPRNRAVSTNHANLSLC